MVDFCYALSFDCAANWVSRYQTLLIGIVALSVAFQQLGISKRQVLIVENQKAQNKAAAQIALDRAFVPLFRSLGILITAAGHQDTGDVEDGFAVWSWSPKVLVAFDGIDMDWDDDKLQEAAVTAYPEDAANIAQLLQAARQAKKLSELYAQKPWDGPPLASDGPTIEVNRELNRFFRSANKVGKLQPHARV